MSKRWGYSFLIVGLWGCAEAQTRVDLSKQSQSADLSAEGPTKPMQVGGVLPATCTTGQMFFLTATTPGANLYACTATNIWTGIVGSGGGGGSVNLTAGTGIVIGTGGSSTTVAVDTTAIPSKSTVQNTTSNIVTVTSLSSATLTGTMNPTLGAYSNDQVIELTWNVSCSGGAMTLAIDSLAAINLVKADGVSTLAPADCPRGATNLFSFDGSAGVFKLMGGGALPATIQFCGTTASCSHSVLTGPQMVIGSVALVSGTPSTATISGISPAFTSSSTYFCTVTAQSGAAGALFSIANTSGSSFTITGPSGSTVVLNYQCVGN